MKSLLVFVVALCGMTSISIAQDLEITCPSDETVECSDSFEVGDPIVTGGQEPYDVVLTESEEEFNCVFVRTYVWEVTDANLEVASCQKQVTIVDTFAPVITFCPEDLELECTDDVPFSQITAEDNCSDVTVTVAEEILSENGCGYLLERTFQAIDECGNTSTCAQLITINDTGCSDPLACDYDSMAEDGSDNCAYPESPCDDGNLNTTQDAYDENCNCVGLTLGCTDILACNFNSEAEIDDGSCLLRYDSCGNDQNGIFDENCECQQALSGFVFIDDNSDGFVNEGEAGLPFQTITIEELNLQVITDDNGEFSVWPVAEGTYTVSVTYSADWENYTTEQIQTITVPMSNDDLVMFGVTNSFLPLPTECIDFYQSGAGVPCNDFLNYNICYRNMSPYSVSGVIEVQLDELLDFQSSTPAADSIVGQSVFWSFENQQSWFLNMDDILVATPSEMFIGEFMSTTAIVYVWFEGELMEVASATSIQEVTCAYDPNDITVIPAGYTDDHLVLPETTLEYVIRFQNTGNAPATNVMIVDTLDPGMDFDSFQFVANSHSVLTTIEPSGRVEFLFANIMLPDSTEDEPGSHGLVSFKIDLIENIDIGEEINSTAYIFFDNNPPVITNTTWTTVHACGDEALFSASEEEVCEGTEVDFITTYPNIEEFTWEIDGLPLGDEEDFGFLFDTAGDYEVHFVAVNPLCADSTSMNIYVEAIPIAEISVNGGVFTASEGDSYQWYADGEPIAGETNQTFTPDMSPSDDGSFYVVVYSELGCSAQSETLTILDVESFNAQSVSVYPNPMRNSTLVNFADDHVKSIRLMNSQGKIVKEWSNTTNKTIEIKRGDLGRGVYLIQIQQNSMSSTIKLVIE